MTTGCPWPWADFDEPIGRTHDGFIMLDDDDGVTLFDEAAEDSDHS